MLHQHKSPVRRLLAERFLLISLISFAATVLIVRLFLELTNYPRVEFGTLHIAHVIWGGLFLFAAALLPIMYANRWALFWSALLSGIGFGLFIDEIGKFITQTNDYFYPPAAPLIYASFLLTVLIYIQFRRPRPATTREDLYHIFSMMEELLDEDLDEGEKSYLIERLTHIINTSTDATLVRLAHSLLNFLQSDLLTSPTYPKTVLLYRWEQLVTNIETFFTRQRLHFFADDRIFLARIYFHIGSIQPHFIVHSNHKWTTRKVHANHPNYSTQHPPEWLIVKAASQAAIGFFSVAVGLLLMMKREKIAIRTGVLVLTTSLTVVNLLVFYLDQFSASINAIFEFALLLGLINYRRRFLHDEPRVGMIEMAYDVRQDEEQRFPD